MKENILGNSSLYMTATTTMQPDISERQIWSAVGSMALCVAMLIASEFMPVSLLTPIARDFKCD